MPLGQKRIEKKEIDLGALIALMWRSKWRLLASTVAGCLISMAVMILLITPRYQATIYMYAHNASDMSSQVSAVTQGDLNASAQLVETYAAIIKRNVILGDVIERSGIGMSAQKLREEISVAAENGTEIFRVTVEHTDPEEAALLANTIADVLPEKLPEIMDGCSVKILDHAQTPAWIAFPRYTRVSTICGIAGMFLCAVWILIRTVTDRTVHSESDLKAFPYPVIGSIPDLAAVYKEDGYSYGKNKKKAERG